jgi:hypothetical protein
MFKSKLKTKYIGKVDGVKLYELKEPLKYISSDLHQNKGIDFHKCYTVPQGFKTDFASVPKGLQFLYKPQGKYSRASVLHDYLYTSKVVSRFKADEEFYQAMRYDGVSLFTASLFYLAVRIGGGKYYG